METKKYKVSQITFHNQTSKKITSGAYYSFLFILSGNCQFFNDNIRHRCGFEELLLMKPNTCLELVRTNVSVELVLIKVQYSPELLSELSDEKTNLEVDLNIVPYICTSVHCESEIQSLCKNLCRKLLLQEQEKDEYACPIFEKSILSMLLVLILRACIHAEFKQRPRSRKVFLIDNLFEYIHAHLTEEITLDDLEKQFFVSKYHILREFKKATGQTLHGYIVKNKLELCQKYIAEGLPITEVYKLGGFGGYNHFFRAFRQEYGMTPKEYYKAALPEERQPQRKDTK